ncbi:MAG TPA: hypothetical protein VF828_03860, partial [Patescibacteria group bacterium]
MFDWLFKTIIVVPSFVVWLFYGLAIYLIIVFVVGAVFRVSDTDSSGRKRRWFVLLTPGVYAWVGIFFVSLVLAGIILYPVWWWEHHTFQKF